MKKKREKNDEQRANMFALFAAVAVASFVGSALVFRRYVVGQGALIGCLHILVHILTGQLLEDHVAFEVGASRIVRLASNAVHAAAHLFFFNRSFEALSVVVASKIGNGIVATVATVVVLKFFIFVLAQGVTAIGNAVQARRLAKRAN